ncbi:MAG: UvrD-helicase domain-containing protein [Labilithrix sp.]|nr:UvrD-helicase domain-containing protein [Labilithrix sp.]MCW5816970.1 UvrD-helicase domain-containing protein [Labilithrix sp.]
MKPLVDAEARRRIAEDLGATLVVEAAAGTGKTTALVERILSLLRTGAASLASGKNDLVAVTFTEKAAGEMKLRLRTEIERARQGLAEGAERDRLDHALEQLEAARIGTIHAFCADLLRERPVEARIDPLFEVAAEDEQERLYDDAFTSWFQATLARPSREVPGVTRVLRRATRERDQDGPRAALRKAGRNLVEQRDFPTPYEAPAFDRKGALDLVIEELKGLGDLASKGFPDSWLTKSLKEIGRVVWEIERREESGEPRDHDAAEAALRALARQRLWGWKGSGQFFNKAEGLLRQEVLDRRAKVKEDLDRTLDVADAELAAALCRELRGIVEEYERRKQKTGKLDFLDLLVLTRDLLADNDAVRAELQRRFGRLLVDEFQDTDPLQAEILFLLAADDPKESDPGRTRVVPGKLFLVGDPKQSIYRFRRADVSFYESIKKRLEKDGATTLQLTTSFRGAPSIQHFVNAAFEPLMPKRESDAVASQAEYVPLAPYRADPEGRPTIIGLPVPRPYGDYGKIVQWQIEESFPDAVGAFVDWLVTKSGWTITERGSDTPVPIRSQHVCLLFKRLQSFGADVTRPYVRALEARRVPHVLVGGRSFHEREEVIALRNALAAIEWPDDTFSVYATLHGPFFAIADDALLAFKHQQRHIHPLRKRDAAKLDDLTQPVADALDVLRRLHFERNRRSVADTIGQLLEATRAHAGVAIWPAGEQALGNILRVLDMARRFEQGAVTSFRGFVLRLEEDSERGGVNEAPVVEEGTDGVRIMTVHKAKGLEFPVVVLVDPTANATFREPSRFVDPARKLWAVPLCGASPKELLERRDEILQQDREEAHRLLYVATTRARELLVVPVVGDDRGDDENKSWLDPLTPVLYPVPEERRAARRAPGCPKLGDDSVFERPKNVERDAEWSVMPGLHRPSVGEHAIVIWDPHALALDAQDQAGLRHERVLKKGPAAAASEERHAAWKRARAETIERAAKPSVVLRTATEAKEDATEAGAPIEIVTTDAERRARPHGKRFGILVHAVLAAAPLDADEATLADVARIQGRLVAATEDEIAAARATAKAALAHPLLARARAAERVEREVDVILQEDDGTILEGIADLAFFERGAGWTVIDFKTDLALGDRRDAYARQIAIYARAIAAATGEEAHGVLLSV